MVALFGVCVPVLAWLALLMAATHAPASDKGQQVNRGFVRPISHDRPLASAAREGASSESAELAGTNNPSQSRTGFR